MREIGEKRAKRGDLALSKRFFARFALAGLTTFVVSATAFAQEADKNTNNTDGFKLNIEAPYNDQTDRIGYNQSMMSGLDLPPESLGSQIFDLDVSQVGCLTGEERCLTRSEMLDMRYAKSLSTSIDTIVDIELIPRASVRFNDDSSSALVGALVRIGDDLKDGEEFKSNAWYIFAGADAEAVTYSPSNLDRVANGNFHLQDRVIVGDAQAGVGYRLSNSTDISLGYFRREVTSFGNEQNMQSTNFTEDAAALSFTWRR